MLLIVLSGSKKQLGTTTDIYNQLKDGEGNKEASINFVYQEVNSIADTNAKEGSHPEFESKGKTEQYI